MTPPEARAMYLMRRIDAASGGRYRRYEDGLELASSTFESPTTPRYDGQGTRLCVRSRRRSSLGLLIRTAPTRRSQTSTRGLGAREMDEQLAVLAHQASRPTGAGGCGGARCGLRNRLAARAQ